MQLPARSFTVLVALALVAVAAVMLAGAPSRAVAGEEAPPRYLYARGFISEAHECLYILDRQTGKLAAVHLNPADREVAEYAGMNVAKNMGIEGKADYALHAVQYSDTLSVLFVIEQISGKVQGYGVNLTNEAIEEAGDRARLRFVPER
jgi:hypothetical protein